MQTKVTNLFFIKFRSIYREDGRLVSWEFLVTVPGMIALAALIGWLIFR